MTAIRYGKFCVDAMQMSLSDSKLERISCVSAFKVCGYLERR